MSYHFAMERSKRNNLIRLIGIGKPIDEFIVDKGHPKGPERHVITDNAIIVIYNYYSGKMVTKLIARPEQIQRYYLCGETTGHLDLECSLLKSVIQKAKEHKAKRYNCI